MQMNDLFTTGGAGIKVSAVGLGTNNFGGRCDATETAAVVHAALDCGINLIDTADIYGGSGVSEEYIGRALGARRGEAVLATKFGMATGAIRGGASKSYVMSAVDDSLRRLRTDYIDLYQFHKPDPGTPIAETLEALDALVRHGKVCNIGCSNMSAVQLEEALAVSRTGGLAAFVTAQNPYSLLDRGIEDGLAGVCEANGIGILPYYPLARGLLTGKYHRGEPAPAGSRLATGGRRAFGALTDRNFDVLEPLEAFCAERGHTLLELAFSWLTAQPAVPCVIAGATTPEQVAANARAADWKLRPDDLAEIDRITGG